MQKTFAALVAVATIAGSLAAAPASAQRGVAAGVAASEPAIVATATKAANVFFILGPPVLAWRAATRPHISKSCRLVSMNRHRGV